MINTISTKKQQLENSYFKTGSGNELVLILGSCRAVPYVGYFDKWNNENGDRFTICFIDPFNWAFDLNDNRIDLEAKILSLEQDENLLTMIRSCTIFIHEYYANFGMFNLDKNSPKNIYQFGMKAGVDIMLPNWNDIFVLTGDIVRFDNDIRKKAIQDYNVLGKLTHQTLEDIKAVKNRNLEKFYDICRKSSFPGFADDFELLYHRLRFFWTFNHIGKDFTMTIFYKIAKLLDLKYNDFLHDIPQEDMFANNYTHLTEYDEGYEWGEEVKPLKDYLL